MAIDITSKWVLDYDSKQLKRERRAYKRRAALDVAIDAKLEAAGADASYTVKLGHDEQMYLRQLLANDKWEQGKVVNWINARLRALAGDEDM